MSKISKDYQKLMAVLDKLKERCKNMAVLEKCVPWGEYAANIQEAMDIISDYEKVVADLNRMAQRYEIAKTARRADAGIYMCPECGKRTYYNHTHCHRCGQKLSWIGVSKL